MNFDNEFNPETATPEQIKAKVDAEAERMKALIVVLTMVSMIQDSAIDQDEKFDRVVDLIVNYGDQRVFESRFK